MLSSSSESFSSDARSSGISSSSGSSSGRSLISETPLLDRIVVALEASQASMDGAAISSFRCPHSLSFTTLRVESLRVKRLAKPFFHTGGYSWGLFNIC